MGAPQAVTIFNTQTGAVLQTYKTLGTDAHGSSVGITYTPDGSHLMFSQDSSYVGIANVNPTTGMLSDYAHVSVPMDVNAAGVLTNVTCFPNSPPGTTGSIEIPCGQTVSIVSDGTSTSYPTGIAISPDQILGDVAAGNGDPSLAVFGDNATFGSVTPNAHALVQRFPLLDNFYDPSRQSADGHNWITQAMAPYSDDIQSPDWLRDYPSNGGDALAYQKKGHLWDQAAKAGVSFKNYGEYIEYNTFLTATGSTKEPLWIDFYNDILAYESGAEKQLYNYNTVASHSPLPNLIDNTVQNYPQFDLGIPDQFRFDIWKQDFQNDVNSGMVPQLEFMWISSDHTGGPPTAQAMQADNDLALGRFVDAISHSSIWSSSAIFSRKTTRRTASTTLTVTAARATSSARMSSRVTVTESPTAPSTRRST
jgi:hypothetical protein